MLYLVVGDDVICPFEWILANCPPFLPSGMFIVLLGLFLIGWHKYRQPFHRFVDLTEIGFDQITGSESYKTEHRKRDAINRINRSRIPGRLPPAFPNGWFVILESTDLSKTGVKEVTVLGLNLVAWRGGSGRVYIADAYCPHLGAHLGVGGKVHGECIKCPFHGWSFDGSDGHLAHVPYSESIPEGAKLWMYDATERNGFIYFWYHAEGDQPTWMPPIYSEIHSGQWRLCGISQVLVGCHVQDIIENGFDAGHLSAVHHDLTIWSGTRWEFFKLSWRLAEVSLGTLGESHVANMKCYLRMSLFGKFFTLPATTVTFTQTGPGLLYIVFNMGFGRIIIFGTVTPLEPLCQKTLAAVYTDSPLLKLLAGGLILSVQANQYKRDVTIWNRKTHLKNPILVKEERALKQFRQWFSQFYSKNSQTTYFNKNGSSNPLAF